MSTNDPTNPPDDEQFSLLNTLNLSTYKPLPEEILEMKEEDTACQYCGISYLLLNKYDKMERYVKQMEKELAGLKEYIHERPKTLQKIQTLELEASSNNSIMTNLQDQVKVFETLDVTQKQTIADLRVDKQKLEERVVDVNSEIEEKNKALGLKEAEIRELKEQLESSKSEFEKEKGDLQNKIRACETKLAEAQNDHEQESALQEEKIKALNATVAEKDEQIQSLTAKLSTQEQRFADETKKLHTTCEIITKEITSLRTQLTTATESNTELKEIKSRLESNLSTKTKDCEELVSKHQELQSKFQALEQSHQTLKSQSSATASEIQKSLNRKDQQIHELTQSSNELKESLKKSQVERNDLIAAHQNRIKQLQDKFLEDVKAAGSDMAMQREQELLGEFEEEKRKLMEEMERRFENVLQSKEMQWRETLQQMRNSKSQVEADRDKRVKDVEETWKNKYGSLNDQLIAYKKKSAEDQSTSSQKIDALERQIESIKEQYQRALSEASMTKSSQRQDSEAVKALMSEVIFLKEMIKQQCEERMALVGMVDSLKRGMGAGGYSHSSVGGGGGVMAGSMTDIKNAAVEVEVLTEDEKHFQQRAMAAKREKDKKIAKLSNNNASLRLLKKAM